jgi:hypothetical protein
MSRRWPAPRPHPGSRLAQRRRSPRRLPVAASPQAYQQLSVTRSRSCSSPASFTGRADGSTRVWVVCRRASAAKLVVLDSNPTRRLEPTVRTAGAKETRCHCPDVGS